MSVYTLQTSQLIPATKEEVWNFISSPANLKHITPSHMGFDILTKDLPEKMYPGMIIKYKVSPLLNIKITWVTEITHVEELSYFVDEQRYGPYTMWHHQHHITQVSNGILMKDIVNYQPPYGILGNMANTVLINKKLKEIFEFRFSAVEKKFGKA
jgi:ligand-binding SRPBCC domain-containing protein